MSIDLSKETKRMRRLPNREVARIDRGSSSDDRPIRAWVSKQFLAVLWLEPNGNRLSVNRVTNTNPPGSPVRWGEGISWDQLMQVKSECGYGDWWAVEVYPPTNMVVNVANIRHLWLLNEAPAYGWRGLTE